MAGSSITFELQGAERLLARLNRLTQIDRTLMEAIATAGEAQTRRRIDEEKRAPDGAAWQAWSPQYLATRGPQHSLLVNERHLADISHTADDDEAAWGTNLIYGATHQFGDASRNIPARPYLGLSPENEEEILGIIEDWLDDRLRGAT